MQQLYSLTRDNALRSKIIARISLRCPAWLKRHGLLVVILSLSLAVRIGYLGGYGHTDLSIWSRWVGLIQQHGLFAFYAQHDPANNYPPLAMVAFGTVAAFPWLGPSYPNRFDPGFLTNHKLLPVLADLLIITAVYFWLRKRRTSPRLSWLALGLLAVAHGPILVSAWWGQLESEYALFAVLSLIALDNRQPLRAWIWFSLGLLIKPQMALLAPLLLILTFRRHGVRSVLREIGVSALIGIAAFAPFVYGSGLDNALSPYVRALDVYPVVTMNALNFWYAVTPHLTVLPWPDDIFPDNWAVVSSISYRTIGLGLTGIYVLLVCVVMWKRYDESREFVWAAALYFGVFMLPTQVHERYLYAAMIFLMIGLAQDRRLWPITLGALYTFAYNILLVAPVNMNFLWPPELAVAVAAINMILLVGLTRVVVFSPRAAMARGRDEEVTTGAVEDETNPPIPVARLRERSEG